jgi:hypothetical protein
MSGHLYIEKRKLQGGKSLSWDLAQHLSTRYEHGAVIIADNPAVLLASVSKQWQRIIRQMQRARSGTLDATLIYELTQRLSGIQRTRMTRQPPSHPPEVDDKNVYFLTREQALACLPTCRTFYCTVLLTDQDIEKLAINLPAGAVLIIYEGAKVSSQA